LSWVRRYSSQRALLFESAAMTREYELATGSPHGGPCKRPHPGGDRGRPERDHPPSGRRSADRDPGECQGQEGEQSDESHATEMMPQQPRRPTLAQAEPPGLPSHGSGGFEIAVGVADGSAAGTGLRCVAARDPRATRAARDRARVAPCRQQTSETLGDTLPCVLRKSDTSGGRDERSHRARAAAD